MFFRKKNVCTFGSHLMIDGYGGDKEALDSREVVYQCLDELPDLIRMHKLAPPEVYHAPAGKEKDCGGWSGFVIVAESHISIHTFALRGFVSIDVYTCKGEIDKKFVTNYFVKKFSIKETEINFVIRGKKYPLKDIY